MIKPLIIERILVDVSLNGVYQWTVNQFTLLDIRKQIIQQNVEGYSIKINPQFWGLFDNDDDIENYIINIDVNGEVDRWFPCYDINEEYDSVNVYSETLSAVLKIRMAQRDKNGK